jgi:tRNA threonylcarbamoyladenosine biosynthesis protein TsaE
MSKTFEQITGSPQQTIELGRTFGAKLKGGEVIALIGNLGTGKTHLIKGIATGAGADQSDIVNSPTFVLVNEYPGNFDIYHIDAYRLDNEKQFAQLGFEDMITPGSIVLIEWADKVPNCLTGVDAININLSHISETQRKIQITNLPGYVEF